MWGILALPRTRTLGGSWEVRRPFQVGFRVQGFGFSVGFTWKLRVGIGRVRHAPPDVVLMSFGRACHAQNPNCNYWVAVKELRLSYYIGETLLFTIYTHYGNLI